MSDILTIKQCCEAINEMSVNIINMRTIVDSPHCPTELRYRAIVIEEALLEVIEGYCKHIQQLKELSVNDIHSYYPKNR
jgi:hypothetical protein